MPDQTIPYVFILGWNRPIYLWVCLDSIHRHTQHPCRIILADNNSTDPAVENVINGFVQRKLFYNVKMSEENDPMQFPKLIEQYWDEIGEYIVFIEADIEILPSNPCWLSKFVGYMKDNPQLGSVGSRLYQKDFVSLREAKALRPDMSTRDLEFLIKARAPMRHYTHTSEPLISPYNPALRLLMMRKSVYEQTGFANDTEIHKRVQALGYQSMISTEVVHRHLSLMNIYDYADYSKDARDTFFSKQQ